MNLLLIQGPQTSNGDSPETFRAAEPVEINSLKDHLRLDGILDDFYLCGLISAARQRIEESECWIQCLTSTWELRLDAFPYCGEPIYLPRPPLQAVISIKYIDAAGDLQTLSDSTTSPPVTSAVYSVDAKSSHAPERGEIYLAYGKSWPVTRAERNAVRIRFRCGFGAGPGDVPAGLRQWMLIAAATMYEHRESEVTGAVISRLQYVDGLLDPWRARELR